MNTASERQWATPLGASASVHPRPQAKTSGGAALRPAQRHTVRLALLSGAVIAAIIGTQALALLDNSVAVQPSQPIVISANATH